MLDAAMNETLTLILDDREIVRCCFDYCDSLKVIIIYQNYDIYDQFYFMFYYNLTSLYDTNINYHKMHNLLVYLTH